MTEGEASRENQF